MTNEAENTKGLESKRRRSTRFLLWVGVFVPIVFSVIVGLFEMAPSKIKESVSIISNFFNT